jgi:CDP-glycerol glycerophosphotransferase (TagB/SpsB family)
MEEKQYICYRKIKASLERCCFYLCRIFPIQKNLISVCTFEGKGGFGCNPKYLVEELHREDPHIQFVWLVNELGRHSFPKYIKEVPNTLWSRAYWLTRSKVWIDNYRKPLGTAKRKGQYYLNVNHFTVGIKCTGLNRGAGFSKMAYLVNRHDSSMIDDLVIDSDWCEEESPKGMVYDGTYLKTGAPRCDVLYGDRTWARIKFRKVHNLPADAKVLMFAPTFREGARDGKRFVFSEIWSIDFKRLINTLERKTGGKWYICVRVHPQLAPSHGEFSDSDLGDRIIDESQTDDMYEILAGMDAYITDYSSAIFEAGYAHIPAFIYADDIEQYKRDRGNLMWDFDTSDLNHVKNNKQFTPSFDVRLPYTISMNNDGLEKHIIEFDQDEYDRRLTEFHREIGLAFGGKASEEISTVIIRKMSLK